MTPPVNTRTRSEWTPDGYVTTAEYSEAPSVAPRSMVLDRYRDIRSRRLERQLAREARARRVDRFLTRCGLAVAAFAYVYILWHVIKAG